jgi:hypothetical protein
LFSPIETNTKQKQQNKTNLERSSHRIQQQKASVQINISVKEEVRKQQSNHYFSQLLSVFAGDGNVLAVFNERMCCDASEMLRCDGKVETKHVFNVVVGKIQQLLQSLSNRRKRALQRNKQIKKLENKDISNHKQQKKLINLIYTTTQR